MRNTASVPYSLSFPATKLLHLIESQKKRYQSFTLKRSIPPFVLLFIIQFVLQLADFRLVIINTVYLQATKEHNRYAAARNKTGNKN